MTLFDNPAPRVWAIVLAAGASTRMGRPKLDLPVDGIPMLRRVVEAALASRCAEVVVVLGAYADRYAPLLDGLPVRVVVNPDPAEGMGSSIRHGMSAVAPDAVAVVVLLADQPLVGSDGIDRVVEAALAGPDRIAASTYRGAVGPPVAFPRARFDELRALTGDRGARSVIDAHREGLVALPLDDRAALDVDTPAELGLASGVPLRDAPQEGEC
jgi:CTP:molybdopterin cytidylyltransferase MocA